MASWLRVWLEIVMWVLLREGIKLKLFLGKYILDIGTWTECIPLLFSEAWIFSVFRFFVFFLRRMFCLLLIQCVGSEEIVGILISSFTFLYE